jgi:hypothetical protein
MPEGLQFPFPLDIRTATQTALVILVVVFILFACGVSAWCAAGG